MSETNSTPVTPVFYADPLAAGPSGVVHLTPASAEDGALCGVEVTWVGDGTSDLGAFTCTACEEALADVL